MNVYTRIVLDMTKDDLPVIESEGFEYSGELALCVDGRGDTGRNDGRGESDTGSDPNAERGGSGRDSNDSFGWGGDIGLNGPAPSTRSAAAIERDISDRELAKKTSYGLSIAGLAIPGLGLAGTLGRYAATHGRGQSEWSDMERAADANGIGEGERGRSSDTDSGSRASALTDALTKATEKITAKDARLAELAASIGIAKGNVWTPSSTPAVDYKAKAQTIIGGGNSSASPSGTGGLGVGATTSGNPYRSFVAPRLSFGQQAPTTLTKTTPA